MRLSRVGYSTSRVVALITGKLGFVQDRRAIVVGLDTVFFSFRG